MDLEPLAWLVLAAGALILGFAKTAIGGAASLSVVIFAAVLPARASTGVLLPVLIAGDVMAVLLYRRHANWSILVRLLPWVAAGTLAGFAFVAYVDDTTMRRTIGGLLLALLALKLASGSARLSALTSPGGGTGRRRAVSTGTGVIAGFCTMVANAAGPVLTLYLLLRQVPKMAFLGTAAWFFLIVNVGKLPFSAALGLLPAPSLLLDLTLLPLVIIGGTIGAITVKRIEQRQFELWTTALTAVSAVGLLVT